MSVPLRDDQIERYSRQIVLPEIGGRGQQRLLAAVVAIDGHGALAAIAARYLAGAGIGELRLGTGLEGLSDELRRLNPEVTARTGAADAATTVAVAADLEIAALDDCVRRTRALGVPLIASARVASDGWLHVPTTGADCAVCAARIAASHGRAEVPALDAVAAGVLGSLSALAALEHALELRSNAAPLRWFAAETSLLTPLAWAPAADCPAHATT